MESFAESKQIEAVAENAMASECEKLKAGNVAMRAWRTSEQFRVFDILSVVVSLFTRLTLMIESLSRSVHFASS